MVGGAYSITAVRLPSAIAATSNRNDARTPKGFDGGTWREARRYIPAGIFQIAAEEVRGRGISFQPYDILPGQAGLAQLAGSGELKRISNGYRIAKPIAHYPAGLHGAEMTNFLLARGVPEPAGDPGHSCVIDEATGQPLPGRRCL